MKRHEQTVGNLDDLVSDMATRAQRPRVVPREAFGQAVQSLLGGIGAGVATYSALWFMGAAYTIEPALFVAGVFAGGAMALRAITDELIDIRRLVAIKNAAKRTVEKQGERINALCAELDRYEQMWIDEQAAHSDTKHLVSMCRVEIAQLRDQLTKRTNYVAPQQATPQVVTDANRLLSNYYATGEWTSRRAATDKEGSYRWTDDRYRAACEQLRDAGIIVTRNTRTDVLPADLAKATEKLNNYLLRVDTNRPLTEADIDRTDDEQ